MKEFREERRRLYEQNAPEWMIQELDKEEYEFVISKIGDC